MLLAAWFTTPALSYATTTADSLRTASRWVLLARSDACLGAWEEGPCGSESLDRVRQAMEREGQRAAEEGDSGMEILLQVACASIDILAHSEAHRDDAHGDDSHGVRDGAPSGAESADDPFLAQFGAVGEPAAPRAVARTGGAATTQGEAVRSVGRGTPAGVTTRAARRSVVLVAPHEESSTDSRSSEVWQVPVREPRVTSRFGRRTDPITGRAGRMHRGIDYGAPTGTPIQATASGRVVLAGWCDRGTGNCIVLDHGDGWRSQYFHLSRVDIRAGTRVSQGDELGAIGSTGRSTGPHLHFQVGRNGEAIDPERLFGRAVGEEP